MNTPASPQIAAAASAYSAFLMVAGIACLVVAAVVWQRRRSATGAGALIVLMLGLSWWDLTYAVFWAGAPGPGPFFWLDITYVGVVVVPGALLVFALRLALHQQRRPLFPVAVLAIEPLLVLALQWTDAWHGMFFGGSRTPGSGMIQQGGPVFRANVIYSYALVLIAIGLLLRLFLRSSGLYRRQAGVVLASIVVAWLNSVVFIAGLGPLPNADNTPFLFSIAALGFAFALLRYRLLDVVPIARDVLVEGMEDGIVVLDTQSRVVDLNPAARRLLAVPGDLVLGEPGERLGPGWSAALAASDGRASTHAEITVGPHPFRHLDVRVSPLRDRHAQFVGRLVIYRDITELKRAQAELHHLAATDGLTRLHNRRFFFDRADIAVISAQRLGQPLALVLMDLDHFKQINDTYGHAAGDQVLVAFAELCRAQLRADDLVARFGGEEFVALLGAASMPVACQIAERIRSSAAQAQIVVEGRPIAITVSLGVAALGGAEDTLELLVQRADQALYAAKREGRDRVVVWQPSHRL